MINNRIELARGGGPKVLITWHLPRPEGHYYPIAFQFADDIDEDTRRKVLDIARRPLPVPQKQYMRAQCGSPDHFGVLAPALGRLGFRTRMFGASQHQHVLSDRPIETP